MSGVPGGAPVSGWGPVLWQTDDRELEARGQRSRDVVKHGNNRSAVSSSGLFLYKNPFYYTLFHLPES